MHVVSLIHDFLEHTTSPLEHQSSGWRLLSTRWRISAAVWLSVKQDAGDQRSENPSKW